MKYELRVFAEFTKLIEIEAASEEEAIDSFWEGNEYTEVSEWVFNEYVDCTER